MRVGLIGAGRQGWRRAAALDGSSEDQLVAVFDINRDSAERLATRFSCAVSSSWEDVFENRRVDAIVICTPPSVHARMVGAALLAGTHTLCEKPMGLTSKEAGRLSELAEAKGLILKAGYNHRHHPGIAKCKEWQEEGRVGDIVFVRARYGTGGREGYDADWRMRREVSGGGQLVDQGLHLLDLARWFLGDFSRAFGLIHTGFWTKTAVEDNVFALLQAPNGQVASLHASWTQWKNLFSFEVYGTDGYVTVDGLGGSYGVERVVLGKRSAGEPWWEESIEFRGEDESWRREWLEFKAAIAEGREPLGGARDAYEALRLAEAVYESARTGNAVVLSITTEGTVRI